MLRIALWLAAFAGFTLALAPLSPAGLRRRFLRRWAAGALRTLGIRLSCASAPSPAAGPALLVANHVSSIDPLLLGAIVPACFVAKSQLAAAAWLRRPLAAAGTIFIDRDRREAVLHALAQMYEALDSDETVALFPEATVSPVHGLHRFNSALLEPGSEGVPVYLVALSLVRGDGAPCPEADFLPGRSFAWGFWRLSAIPELVARAVVLGPFDFSGVPRKRIALIAHEAIDRALRERIEEPAHTLPPWAFQKDMLRLDYQ
ncbi:MAG: lysophospholipid acyltransferase family protein [Burkholderiales bacterium]